MWIRCGAARWSVVNGADDDGEVIFNVEIDCVFVYVCVHLYRRTVVVYTNVREPHYPSLRAGSYYYNNNTYFIQIRYGKMENVQKEGNRAIGQIKATAPILLPPRCSVCTSTSHTIRLKITDDITGWVDVEPPHYHHHHHHHCTISCADSIYFVEKWKKQMFQETNKETNHNFESESTYLFAYFSYFLLNEFPFSVLCCRFFFYKGMNTSTALRWQFAVAQIKIAMHKEANNTATTSIVRIEHKWKCV